MSTLAMLDGNKPVSISQIAKDEELSPEFLEQIFFRLKKAGVIRSIRGPKGGFMLNKNPSEITVKSVLDAVGELLYPAPCTDPATAPCKRQSACTVFKLWQGLYDVIEHHLAGITLADILESGAEGSAQGKALAHG